MTKSTKAAYQSADSLAQIRQAAEQGDVEAQVKLGAAYHNGEGVEQDFAEAVKWFRLAAAQGNAQAQNSLGYVYMYGKGVEQDEIEAVKWIRLAAEQGFAKAQDNLGTCYMNGMGIEEDRAEAVKWHRLAAIQGFAKAQNNLGAAYFSGEGVKQDFDEAVKWWRLAAEQGNAAAQNNLGRMYSNGHGVAQNYVEAANWYRKAAEHGYAGAQHNLLAMYWKEYFVGIDEKMECSFHFVKQRGEEAQPYLEYSLIPDLIESKESPREIIAADFELMHGKRPIRELPIRGGWGYSQDDACIIDLNDPIVDPSVPFSGIEIEHVFAKIRAYEEMVIFRPESKRFFGIRHDVKQQALIHKGEKAFERLFIEITAFLDDDWSELRSELEASCFNLEPEFDIDAYDKKRQEKMVRFTREVWFDITGFFGRKCLILSDPIQIIGFRQWDAEKLLHASAIAAAVQPKIDAVIRKTRLKALIKLGKERGYLTYAEINDHLPDDVGDAEEIESIISTFSDMGIKVFDEAPAAEEMLMSDVHTDHTLEEVGKRRKP